MMVGLKVFLTYFVSLILLILSSRLPDALAAANLPSYEMDALYDIYISTNGDNWLWGLGTSYFPGIPWNFSGNPNPCEDIWQGINCTSTSTNNYVHVSGIDLGVMFLEGTLPDSIGMFPMLQQLYLSANILTGTLPGTISNLTNLQILDLSSNVFQKRLPGTLGALVSMVELYVQNNLFTGPLPDLGNLTQLTKLNYAENYINESISPSLGNLLALQVFIAENNMLTGYIPDSFGQLAQLTQLDLSYNQLSGSLSDSLGQLVNLQTFTIASNFITGEIPSSLGNLSQLTSLNLYSNLLHSTIPSSFGAMASLRTLSLQANHLHGTIPSSLCDITGLLGFRAMNNILTGQIPPCLVLNSALNTLVLYNNRLSGPLPDIYAPDSQLSYFDVNGPNFLTGTLPPALGQLPNLEYLYAGINQLTGPIPAALSNISSLLGIYIKYNALTSTLPPELSALQNAIFLEVSGNFLTGTLPESWATLTGLHELHVDQNIITGTLPNSYMNLVRLQVLNVYKNILIGTIPNSLDRLTLMQYIGFDFNQFSGTLPVSVGNLSNLVSLEVNGNRLTGRLPSSIRNLTLLTILLVNDNHLTGTLDAVFDSSKQTSLNIIQLSDNEFTGSVPEEPFRIQQLMTFAAVGNCFQGSLPQAVCGSKNLQVLALSGLQSSPACQTLLLPGIAKSYISKSSPISGGIPACLFEMPRLVQLQLSGNGLTGSLPDSISMSSFLVDVTLSHNTLSGTIPMVFQQREWLTFDLSYNRMYGTLSRHLETKPSPLFNLSYSRSALSLQNNRLSGEIPDSVKPMVNISVLSGNLFNCNLRHTNLPDHDPAASNYQCGSTTFEVPYYLWLALVLTLAALCLAVWQYRNAAAPGWLTSYVQMLLAWYFVLVRCSNTAEVSQRYPMLNTRYLTTLFNSINKIAQICAVYAVVVLMPLYAVLSTYSNTLQHQYAYSSSAAFHKGKVATALEMVFLILLQCVALSACVYYWKAPDARVVQQAKRSASVQAKTAQSSLLSRLAVYCALVGTNMFVVFGVNIAYIYVALYESSSFLLFTQILLSMFKLGWNKFCGSSLIPWTARYISPSVTTDLQSSTVEFFPLQLFLSLFNNIVIPCVVVAVVSPNCFSYAFSNSPSVTVEYIVDQCDVLNDETDQCDAFIKQIESTTFNPPFTYSYQCSASFVTYYAPAFVIMCIMSTFAVPALQSLLVLLYHREVDILSRKGVTTWRFRLLDAVLPRLLKPPTSPSTTSFALNTVVAAAQATDRGTVLLQRDIYSPHFPANQVLLNMLTFLGILLTFGAVFPPLAVSLAGTVVGTAVYARLKMGRFLSAALDQRHFKFLDLVDKECEGVGTLGMLVTGVFMLLSFSCAFYTLFLFDALGDSVSLEGAYWVLIFMPLVPVVMYAAYCAYIAHAARHTAERTALSSAGIELRQSTLLPSAAAEGLVAAAIVQASSPTVSVTSEDTEHEAHAEATKDVLSVPVETAADIVSMLHRDDNFV